MSTDQPTRRAIEATAWLYEPLRRYFSDRQERHQSLRRALNGAHVQVTVSEYLARSALLAILAAVAGAGVGSAATVVFADAGVIASITGMEGFGGAGTVVGDNRTVVVGAVLTLGIAAVAGVGTWYARYYRPRQLAAARARKVNLLLPHAVTYMYALSRGGIDIASVFRRLADSESTYGEAAKEARVIVNHMDYLGRDFTQALSEASEVTPSSDMADFLNDLVSVVESGGDVDTFLAEKREVSIQDARSAQKSYIETISLFAEVYVTLVVAGSLFALVLLMVMGILGGETLGQVNVLVYVGIPAGSALSLVVLDILGAPFAELRASRVDHSVSRPDRPDDPAAADYARQKRRHEWWSAIRHPLRGLIERPTRALWVSVPLAVVVLGLLVVSGTVRPTLPALYGAPVRTTTLLAVLPGVVAVLPVTVFYEIKRRYVETVLERFPDLLASLASSNRMGIRLTEAIREEADRSEGVLSTELERAASEISWFDDLHGALLRVANRAKTGIAVRSLRLIAESERASGNLAEALSVSARDARNQRYLVRERARELSAYTVAAGVAYLVFLGVLLMIDQYYFQRAIQVSQETATTGAPGMPASLEGLDVEAFELAFFHSALVQAVFIGLVAGKLTKGTVLAGLKISLVLAAVTIVAFGVI